MLLRNLKRFIFDSKLIVYLGTSPRGFGKKLTALTQLLRHNVHIHRRRMRQEPLDRIQIQIFLPAMDGRTAKDHLGDLVVADELSHRPGYVASLYLDELGAEILRKANVGRKLPASLFRT